MISNIEWSSIAETKELSMILNDIWKVMELSVILMNVSLLLESKESDIEGYLMGNS
jgi:hypothetical protein